MILLLIFIYITFISLGLPDSLFGAAWPVMHVELGVKESFASVYMIITAVGSGGMSFIAGPLIRKFGTGRVTVVSVFLTAAGMLTIGFAPSIWVAIVGSIMMGLGAGAIDTGLNNFVSTHYKASHMNWLHCFWGVGVTVSPLIMSVFLGENNNWRGGYLTVSYIQFGIAALLIFTLPLWKKYEKTTILDAPTPPTEDKKEDESVVEDAEDEAAENAVVQQAAEAEQKPQKQKPAIFRVFKIRGVIFAVLALGFYCSMEFLIGTWGASYIVNVKQLNAALAAKWISLYYGGIMIGRFLSGFLSFKLNDKNLIRLGESVALFGIIFFALPLGEVSLIGLLLVGIGFGPIFPSTIHATPFRFGTELSADITGIQMGGAYAIGWAIQLTFGFVAPATTFAFMPYLLMLLSALLLLVTEILNKKTEKPLVTEENL